MASHAACEYGAEEQIVDHVVLQSLIHRPPHKLHGLTVTDDETLEWLLNTCPRDVVRLSSGLKELAQKTTTTTETSFLNTDTCKSELSQSLNQSSVG